MVSDAEELIQTIIDDPVEDAPRLAYADWLERRGPSAHAELIRVQCELARIGEVRPNERKEHLNQRQRELLDSPEFESMDWARGMGLKFDRGFIPQVDYGSEGYDSYVEDGEPVPTYDWRPFRDKVLTVHFFFGQDSWPGPRYMQAVGSQDWWRRVTCLQFDQTQPAGEAIEALAASPHLLNLRQLLMHQCVVPVESMHSLVLANSIRGLRRLALAFEVPADTGGSSTDATDDLRLNAFLVRIACSPKVGELEDLGFNFLNAGVGNEGARALFESRYLNNLRRLYLMQASAIAPELRARLRERFGAVDLVGSDYLRIDD